MEKTIKDIEVIAYKGMEFNMTCKGFHYEIGKTYKTDKVELCEYGFHACLNPIDVLDYYPKYASSRYFKVKLSGEVAKCDISDTKVAATEITILEEIPSDKFLTNIEWWKNDNVLDLLYFSDGFARVQRSDKLYNFINRQGKFLSDEWFKFVDYFKDGFARVQRTNSEYNYIDKNGKIISEQWFKLVDYFNNGFARVQRSDNLCNFINKDGKLLTDEWFNRVFDFKDGFARVKRTNGEWCEIDKTGTLIN